MIQDTHTKYISVIIPVYNDALRLDLCLHYLSQQSYPKDFFEIIVIDNGSHEPINYLKYKYKNVHFDNESSPGSYHARNRGIQLAKGDILAFTDADCLPDKDWLLMGAKAIISQKDIGLVGGRIDFYFKNSSHPRIAELYDSITYLQQHNAVSKKHFAATANMFTWKNVMDKVGMFDTSLMSGGDREWGERVSSCGLILYYEPHAVIRHPARHSFYQITKRNLRINGGHHQLRQRQTNKYCLRLGLARELAKDLCPPVIFTFRVATDDRIKGFKNKFLVTAFHMLAKISLAWARISHSRGRRPSRS